MAENTPKLKKGEVLVYPPNSAKPVAKTLANARDLVNGAGWAWRPNDPSHTPAALSPYQGLKAGDPGVEEILKGDGIALRPEPGQVDADDDGDDTDGEDADADTETDGTDGEETETVSDGDEAQAETASKTPTRTRRASRSK